MLPKKLLESLEIKNFRGFKHLQVEKLGHVNLIVGQNNVGKSSVLEALRIYAGLASPALLSRIAQERGEPTPKDEFQDENLSPIENGFKTNPPFAAFFYGREFAGSRSEVRIGSIEDAAPLTILQGYWVTEDGRRSITSQDLLFNEKYKFIDKDDSEAVERLSGLALPILLIHKDKKTWPFILQGGRDRIEFSTPKDLKRINCSFISPNISSNSIKLLASLWDNIQLTHEETVLQALRLIEPSVQKLAFIEESGPGGKRSPLVLLKGQTPPIPLLSMGDGMSRVLQLVLNAISAEDGFLLIDEFENGLHHSAQTQIWQLIFELAKLLNIQVFAATHSLNCVKTFAEVAKQRGDMEGVLITLARSTLEKDANNIVAKILDEQGLETMLAMGIEVR